LTEIHKAEEKIWGKQVIANVKLVSLSETCLLLEINDEPLNLDEFHAN